MSFLTFAISIPFFMEKLSGVPFIYAVQTDRINVVGLWRDRRKGIK